MKKRGVILTVIAAIVILVFVISYALNTYQENQKIKISNFDHTVEALSEVMTNYLLGEQRICNNWSHYVNAEEMTMDEAIQYIRLLKTSEGTAHIIYLDDGAYTGRSTAFPAEKPDLDSVSYAHIDILDTLTKDEPTDNHVNVTKAYINPIDNTPSVAFCYPIYLKDPGTGMNRRAVMMRVIPEKVLDLEWVFLTEQYEHAESAMTDGEGNFLIKGKHFKGKNIREFCLQSKGSEVDLTQFMSRGKGHFFLEDEENGAMLVSFAPLHSTDERMIVGCIPISALGERFSIFVIIVIVASGLLIILTISFGRQLTYRRKLAKAETDATNAVKTTNNFLNTMSKDFHSPLNSIMGVTAIASSRMDDEEVVGDCLRKIGLSSNHMNSMLNDVLDVFRVENGELRLSPAPFSIVDSASSLVNMSQSMLREKNIDFSFHIGQLEFEDFYADQVRVNQILMNILAAALKYCPQGGRVHVALKELQGSEQNIIRMVYSVTHTGRGVTQEMLQQLDDLFGENNALQKDAQDIELNLAITRKIVRMMNGSITVSDEIDGESTITVTIDLQRIRNKHTENMALPSVRVLIVDQNADLRTTSRETLQSLGAMCDTAVSGYEAVEMLKAAKREGENYDIVILGRRMPELDGVESARLIRSEIEEPVPKLLISAYDWTDLRGNARDAGVDGFISKPLFRSTLYKKISSVMGIETVTTLEEEAPDYTGMHILVVEDNDINWSVVSMLLQKYGIVCERAENGQKAVDRIAEARDGEFSMVFMDIRMPVMNGLEATRAIRKLPTSVASIPIIAMTSENFIEDVEKCIEAGMNGHIAKPIDLNHLLNEIQKVRDKSRYQDVDMEVD